MDDEKLVESFRELQQVVNNGVVLGFEGGFVCTTTTDIVEALQTNHFLLVALPELFDLTKEDPSAIGNFYSDTDLDEEPDELSVEFDVTELATVSLVASALGGDAVFVEFSYDEFNEEGEHVAGYSESGTYD